MLDAADGCDRSNGDTGVSRSLYNTFEVDIEPKIAIVARA